MISDPMAADMWEVSVHHGGESGWITPFVLTVQMLGFQHHE